LIAALIETRAKGGNLLLNVGPKPDGELPIEQEERLREIALWMFVNGESIYGVRPWVITNEGDYWFTRAKSDGAVYLFVKEKERWKYGEWKEIALRSVRATDRSQISVLGQNDKVLEYRPDVVPKTTWRQEGDVLKIRAMRAQRLYNDRKWPNPVVLKITHVTEGLTPPQVVTGSATLTPEGSMTVEGSLVSLGNAPSVYVGFEYRSIAGVDVNERSGAWRSTPLIPMAQTGKFAGRLAEWKPGEPFEYRAVVKHPVLMLYGDTKRTPK